MPQLCIIYWEDLYFYGFSLECNPLWALTIVEAKMFEAEEARRWVKALKTIFDISGLEIQRVE